MSWWKPVVREPLVHFVIIGAALFAIDYWRSAGDPAPASPAPPTDAAPLPTTPTPTPRPSPAAAGQSARSIVIDAEVRKLIAANAERRLGRPPTAAELADETQRWIDEEVLYREAVARGLDRDDPIIHQRIAARMSYVLEQAAVVPEPTEAELRAWFEQHRARWTVAEHVDFTHVFVAGSDAAATARADQLEAALASGAAPERLGDRFSGGHRYRGRKIADLAAAFGDTFVDGLAKQKPGTWVRRTSRHGIHLVRVDRIDAPQPADFARARLDVRKEWVDARRAAEVGAAMKQLRSAWTIEQR